MCGIVGYLSYKKIDLLKSGIVSLKRLEYRGYDSAGWAGWDFIDRKLVCRKSPGRISEFDKEFANYFHPLNPVILHTRWSTHGKANKVNAHPQWDCKKNIFLVHNGIIENYKYLKEKLIREGHKFRSNTDTEVIAHLVEKFFKGNLESALRKALKLVKGAYGLALISSEDPGKIVAARFSSPLLIGITKEGYVLASDPVALLGKSNRIVYLEDGEIAVIEKDDFRILKSNGREKEFHFEKIDFSPEEADKKNFSCFMLKEIFEEPEAVENSIRGRLLSKEGFVKFGGLERVEDRLKKIKKLLIVGCGTAGYAGKVGKYMIEEYTGISVEADVGSEFRYRKPVFDKNTALLAISQSGETADTLAAIKEAKRKGILTIGITNVLGSTQTRETDVGVYNHCGPEIAVASTKAFISQLTILALLTVYFGRQREMSLVTGKRIIKEIKKLPDMIKTILKQDEYIKNLAEKYSKFSNFFFLGRKYNYPIALEGALKLKEVAYYVHAEGYPAGEIKHGVIALVDKNFPTFAIALSDSVYEKMLSNIEELKARGGPVIAIATKNNKDISKLADDVIYIPKTLEMLSPILTAVPFHLFAAHLGLKLGLDVDKPRNLAKSVTVE